MVKRGETAIDLSAADKYYLNGGRPCCAGCDWWQTDNKGVVGICTKSAPVEPKDRVAMLGIQGLSLDIGAGHVFTRRDHYCGDFSDTYDWGNTKQW